MPRSKTYLSQRKPILLADERHEAPPVELTIAKVNFAEASGNKRNPTSNKGIDLTGWIGGPRQEWADAWCRALRYLLGRGDMAVASCVKLGQVHSCFFEFLGAHSLTVPPAAPPELRPRHIRQFVEWLKGKYSAKTARNYYKATRSVLLAMMDLGLITGEPDEFFTRNPFPGSTKADPTRQEIPLSQGELERLVAALKKDLISLHRQTFDASNMQAISVYLLVIAIRTGGNPTPVLELARGALRPHLVPGMMRLDLVKYRGANTYSQALRSSETAYDAILSVPMDGVAVLTKVLEATKELAAQADATIQDRVWLYRPERGGNPILCLNQVRLERGIAAIVRRHNLRADNGELLRLNLSRLRKNKAHQLWKLSSGDLATVALLLGNTPRVAAENYLTMTPAIRAEGAAFIGEAFEAMLSGNAAAPEASAPPLEKTPVGSCRDSLNGGFAPKDGVTHCDQFLHCLGCPSYAIVGTVPDLHRLFSFQAYMRAEIEYFPREPEFDEWRAHRTRLILLIDDFTGRHFKKPIVDEARALSLREPHKFWAIQLSTLQRLDRDA